jgi:hyperosmotically inducible protein
MCTWYCSNAPVSPENHGGGAIALLHPEVMKVKGKLSIGVLAACLMAAGAMAQTPPDNTKANQADRGAGAVTADQGKNNLTDRDLAQKIRKSIVGDTALSTYAHNVKVIAQGGKVTLKGPVRSTDEKQSVEQKATEVAGAGNVDDQITIKPASSKKPN